MAVKVDGLRLQTLVCHVILVALVGERSGSVLTIAGSAGPLNHARAYSGARGRDLRSLAHSVEHGARGVVLVLEIERALRRGVNVTSPRMTWPLEILHCTWAAMALPSRLVLRRCNSPCSTRCPCA